MALRQNGSVTDIQSNDITATGKNSNEGYCEGIMRQKMDNDISCGVTMYNKSDIIDCTTRFPVTNSNNVSIQNFVEVENHGKPNREQ